MTTERFVVEEHPEEFRYVLIDRGDDGEGTSIIGEESFVDVAAVEGVQRVLFHTGVSEDYAGRGLASRLVRAAVEHTISTGRTIVPVCPYVAAWLPKHPEYGEHVVEPRAEHLNAVRASQQR